MFLYPLLQFRDNSLITWCCLSKLIFFVSSSHPLLLFTEVSSINESLLSKAILLHPPVCFFIPSYIAETILWSPDIICPSLSCLFLNLIHFYFSEKSLQSQNLCYPRPPRLTTLSSSADASRQHCWTWNIRKAATKIWKRNIMIILPLAYSRTQQLETLWSMFSYFCDVWCLIWLQSAIKS